MILGVDAGKIVKLCDGAGNVAEHHEAIR